MNHTLSESFYTILNINRIDQTIRENKKNQLLLNCASIFLIFIVIVTSGKDRKQDAFIFCLLILLCICFFFGLNVHYEYRNRELRFLKYKIEKEELENRLDLAEMNGLTPEAIMMEEIKVPSNEVKLPIVFYSILILLDILAFIFLY